MFHPDVVAAREAKLHDTLGDRIPGGRLVRSSRERCWGFRDRLAKAWSPKKGLARPLTAEEQTFIRHEQLLITIDRRYWLERYAYVVKETADLEPLTPLWKSQDLFLAHLAAHEKDRYFSGHPDGILFNVLKARQLGISTITEALLAGGVTSTQSIRGLVAADVEEQSKSMFAMAELVIEHLPWWLKPLTVAPTTTGKQLTFATGASLRTAWGKSARGKLQEREGTKGNIGRGKTFGLVHLSELSTWERPEQIDDGLIPGIPRRPRSFAVFESTAKGRYDWWHKQWDQAERGVNRFYNIFIPWYIEPDKYWLPAPEGWAPVASTLQHAAEVERDSPRWTLGETVRLGRDQLYWYEQTRKTFDDENLGAEFTTDGRRVATFYEEYPACLTADARVSTQRGILPIAEIRTGDVTPHGAVVGVYGQTPAPIYQLTTTAGRVLSGTADHPMFRPDGTLTDLATLQPGDALSLVTPNFSTTGVYETCWTTRPGVTHTCPIGEVWGAFLGYFMGDGSWWNGQIDIVCDAKDEDVIADVRYVMTHLFGNVTLKPVARTKGRKGAVIVRAHCQAARELFLQLGIIQRVGHARYRRRVCVPEAIWRSPIVVVRAFLRTLFECDGAASGSYIAWGSMHVAFAREVQQLLLGFGIPVTISPNPKRAGNGVEYPFFRTQFTRAQTTAFMASIGFVGARKAALATYTPRRHPRTRAAIGRAAIPLSFEDTVASIAVLPPEVTYDLTIAGTHVFAANGLLTHNSPRDAFQHAGQSVFGHKVLERLKGYERPPIAILDVAPAKDLALLAEYERMQKAEEAKATVAS